MHEEWQVDEACERRSDLQRPWTVECRCSNKGRLLKYPTGLQNVTRSWGAFRALCYVRYCSVQIEQVVDGEDRVCGRSLRRGCCTSSRW